METTTQPKDSPSTQAHAAPLRGRSRARARRLLARHLRERERIVEHHDEISGLLPLLMKQRNGQRWENDERHDLHWRLRRFAHVSPYLAILLVPGSIVFLPLIAWLLDRREGKPRRTA